uniref:Glycosyl hydrolase family 32 n=1 Tax=Prevotella sp. GTC17259 TaxID=3236795 RepID=A0AB33JAW5_9BACT
MKRVFISILLFSMLTSAHAQTLSNGIELPAQWPPRLEIPTKRAEMPVPYLQTKPRVIPINVGRQLFVDDFLISSTNLKRIFHTPHFYEGNPVLEPDKEWEKTRNGVPYAAPFSDGIWYDELDNKYKMWYLAGANNEYDNGRQTFHTCYAESNDGKKWIKPNLGLYGNTNIVDTCNRDAATIWLDRNEKDFNKRWKFFNIERRATDGRWQMVLKYSSDGIHWSKGVAQSGDLFDRTTAFYNPFTNKWGLSMRYSTDISSRSRAYVEHSDPEMLVSIAHRTRKDVQDKNIVFWFTPDDKELHHEKYTETKPGIYNFDCIPYESIMLGFYSAWQGPENNICAKDNIQKRNVISLGYSRDGFHFSRPTHTPFMNVNETEGAWNWGNMQSINGVPLIVGDSLYFYSSGRRLNNIFWDGYSSTGLATLRRDGFVSIQSGKQEGFLETETITFNGEYLFVNADMRKGVLKIEILDEEGNIIPGFSYKDCIAMKGRNSTKWLITWKNKKNLASINKKNVHFKFYLKQGELYSFWVSPWITGESCGYTAGGGPDLSPKGIDIK